MKLSVDNSIITQFFFMSPEQYKRFKNDPDWMDVMDEVDLYNIELPDEEPTIQSVQFFYGSEGDLAAPIKRLQDIGNTWFARMIGAMRRMHIAQKHGCYFNWEKAETGGKKGWREMWEDNFKLIENRLRDII